MKKHANLQAVGSLQDFLNNNQTDDKSIKITFTLNPAVKDVIESCGIPHTAVFTVKINGEEHSSNYNLREGDSITVYPFESVSNTNADPIYCCPSAFILDVHLGKLARTLRLFGIDASLDTSWEDADIIRLSNQQRRMILTRDLGLLKTGAAQFGYWVRSKDPDQQIEEIFKRFNIRDHISPFSRCMKCNGPKKQIPLSKVEDRIPPKVKQWHSQYWECATCHQVYWKGSHFKNLKKKVEHLTGKYLR